jgi:hypothetical protein
VEFAPVLPVLDFESGFVEGFGRPPTGREVPGCHSSSGFITLQL